MHVPARVALAGAIELPHQRHQRVAGAGQPLAHRREVQMRQVRLAHDLAGGGLRDDPQLGLGPRERSLHVQPRLKARRLGEQRAHAGVVDPERSRLFEHGVVSSGGQERAMS